VDRWEECGEGRGRGSEMDREIREEEKGQVMDRWEECEGSGGKIREGREI